MPPCSLYIPRSRVLWLSVSTDLRKDAERDLADVGCRMALFPKVHRQGGGSHEGGLGLLHLAGSYLPDPLEKLSLHSVLHAGPRTIP